MKVLAIDPGYGRCGIAVVEKNGGDRERVIYSNCIETSSKDAFPERLAAIVTECLHIFEEYGPDTFAIEKLFFTNNQKTAMQVAEVRGALIALAATRDIPVSEYTPMQVKSATAGWGGADKQQIIQTVRMLVHIEKEIKHDDEYDAIAIGITHLAHSRGIKR
ncbi:MAG: ruvC [Candidatus Kaiserbacteria bacterium]|nr:ruvC [Candidatus Kaiserbacteria bacterium]